MITIRWMMLALLSPIFLVAQNQKNFKIKEERTGLSIAYVTCFNKTLGKGVYSSSEGELTMDVNLGDTLVFSCMAYEDDTLFVNNFEEKEVYLKTKSVILGEVSISSKNIEKKKKLKVGYKKKTSHRFGIGVYGTEVARYFNDSSIHGKVIQRLIVPVKTDKEAGVVRLHLYSVDSNGMPYEDLIPVNIVLTDSLVKRKAWVADLTEYNIVFPENGVFVSTEYFFTVHQKVEEERKMYSYMYQSHEQENKALVRNRTRQAMYNWSSDSYYVSFNMNFAFYIEVL